MEKSLSILRVMGARCKYPLHTENNECMLTDRRSNDPESSQRVGQNGPLLIKDFHLIDLLAHFDRERIPERVVHAKGAGAYGEFELLDDISDLVFLVDQTLLAGSSHVLDVARHAQCRWQEDKMRRSILYCWRRERLARLSA